MSNLERLLNVIKWKSTKRQIFEETSWASDKNSIGQSRLSSQPSIPITYYLHTSVSDRTQLSLQYVWLWMWPATLAGQLPLSHCFLCVIPPGLTWCWQQLLHSLGRELVSDGEIICFPEPLLDWRYEYMEPGRAFLFFGFLTQSTCRSIEQ